MTPLPTVTRTTLRNGHYRYEVDGVVHTARSRRLYQYASAYLTKDGDTVVFLHARRDLALKGSYDAKRAGHNQLTGVIEIEEAS